MAEEQNTRFWRDKMPSKAGKKDVWTRPSPRGSAESNSESNDRRIICYDGWLACSSSPKPQYRSFLEGTWARVDGDKTRFDGHQHP